MHAPTLSPEGAGFIGAFEGFSPTCYDDGGRPGLGNCTIGYGHLVHYGPTTPADRRKWGNLTRPQAARLLAADAHTALLGVERHITVPLTRAQVDALCSFAYNCGPEALAGAVAAAVNSKPARPWPLNLAPLKAWHARVAAALEPWDHAAGQLLPGLWRRRHAEAVLFAHRLYTTKQGNPFANA